MRKQVKYLSLLSLAMVALLVSFVGGAFGQSATGTITGTVTDPKGLAMVGVNVLIHNVDTGVDHAPVMTNDQGVYNVPLLQPGNYDITVSQTGFSTVKRAAVSLQVGATARIDIEMPVSAQQTLVTVTTELPVLETEKTEQSQNVSEALVSNLPISSRNWAQFALLTPGVNPDGVSGGMSFHGINNLYNNIQVDGANANYNYDGGARGGTGDGYVYSSDSVREFQVASSGFNAEIGQSAGGSVNTVTKSGTNQYHGDLFYSGRSAAFNAIDPVAASNALAKGATPTQSVHQQHQYGGSLGGSLIKDKLFFFTTVDQYRKVNPITEQTSLNGANGNPTINSLSCPTLALGAAAGTAAPTAGQCQAVKDFYNNHILGTFPQNLWQDVELIKVDSQINASNHISAVTDWRDRRNHIDPADFIENNSAFNQDRSILGTWTMVIGSNKVNEFRYQYAATNSFSSLNPNQPAPGVQLTGFILTASGGNTNYGQAGGGSSWTKETRHQVTDNFSWTKGNHALKFGVDMNFITDDARSANNSGGLYTYSNGYVLPAANISCPGGTSAGTPNNLFCDYLMDLYGLNAGDGRTGRHFDTFNQFFDLLYPTFPTSFRYLIPNKDYGAFAQDTWKLRPNLTLNIGVRYDNQRLPTLPNAPALHITGSPTLPAGSTDLPIYDTYTSVYPSENDNIQPRFGLAWNVARKTVIRFSGGVFAAKTEGHNVKNAFSGAGESTTSCSTGAISGSPGTSTSVGLSSSCPATSAGFLSFPQVYFYQQNGGLGSAPVPGAVPVGAPNTPSVLTIPSATFGIRGVDPTLKRPEVYTLTGAFEQQLPGNMSLSLSYVYTKGIRLPRGRDFNIGQDVLDPGYCSGLVAAGSQTCGLTPTKTYDVVDASGNTVTSVTIPFFTSRSAIAATGGAAADPAYTVRVDPRTGVINGNSATAYSKYNGFIASLRKPMSHGLELQANYTLSYASDSGEQGGGNSGEGQVGIPSMNPYNDKAEWGNSGTDTRNRFVTSVVYAPSFQKYTSSAVGKELLGGWSVASSITAQNGGHYTAMTSGSTGKALKISGFLPGQTSGAATTFSYSPLDGGMSGVFITSPGSPAPSRLAWLPPGGFVLPNLYNVDLRLEKEFSIKERYHIAIRGEAFNLFNSTLVQAVNQNAYKYVDSGSAGCPSTHLSTTTCMVPVAGFGSAATTTGNNLRARELQAGVRFEF